MRSKTLIVLGLLLAVLVGVLVYGVHAGDAQYVLQNAQNFCFT
jgi:hypothetical protein